MKIKNLVNYWLPPVLWCGVIFTFSSLPTVETSQIYWWDFVIKKTAHMVEYAILYFLVNRALKKTIYPSIHLSIIYKLSFLFTLLYAFSDEFHQRFVPGRHSKLRDVGFDFIGMLIAFLIIKKKSKNSKF